MAGCSPRRTGRASSRERSERNNCRGRSRALYRPRAPRKRPPTPARQQRHPGAPGAALRSRRATPSPTPDPHSLADGDAVADALRPPDTTRVRPPPAARSQRRHIILRRHVVPLHRRRPDPEGRRRRHDLAAGGGGPARPRAEPERPPIAACGYAWSTIPSSAAPRRAPTAASTSPSTAAASSRSRSSARATSPRSARSRSRRRSSSASRTSCWSPTRTAVTGVDLDARRAAGRAGRADHRRRRHAPADAAVRAGHRGHDDAARTAREGARRRSNVRATEFTIGDNGPAAMPGELPPTSRLHVRGRVLGRRGRRGRRDRRRSSTSRSSPTSTTSSASPPARRCRSGYYDREQGAWVAGAERPRDRDRRRGRRRARRRHRRRRRGRQRAALGIDDAERASSRSSTTPARAVARRDHALHAVGLQLAYGAAGRRRRPRPERPDDGDPDGDDPCSARAARSSSARPGPRRAAADHRHAVHARLPVRPRAGPRPATRSTSR